VKEKLRAVSMNGVVSNRDDLAAAQSYFERAATHLRVMCLGALAVAWSLLSGPQSSLPSKTARIGLLVASILAALALAMDLLESYFGGGYFMQLAGVHKGASLSGPWKTCQVSKQVLSVISLFVFLFAIVFALVPVIRGQQSGLSPFLIQWSGSGGTAGNPTDHWCMHLDLGNAYGHFSATLDDHTTCVLKEPVKNNTIILQCKAVTIEAHIDHGLLVGNWSSADGAGPFTLYPRPSICEIPKP